MNLTNIFLCLFLSDDIMHGEDGPLCAAEIGSELQKQFAILPGWFDAVLSWASCTLGGVGLFPYVVSKTHLSKVI